ncbi:hypothetical protein D5S18_02750 [Nocardia panacis]|uniref:SCP2 domain-containing protein n=1 Tax=Nocardia panacis TaxID=2340916 RepID=A0A3A4KI27_9NOCA|nr:SCP2 sterol-binding domain-containing protein [Nocardia panacis]RJO79269.1 hypothetical protein D5S18_02750 [Nocardia panacis]
MSPEITEAEFVSYVSAATDSELAALMADPDQRRTILDRIFELWCAGIDTNKTRKVEAIIRWIIGTPPDTWDMHICRGACTAIHGPGGLRADTTITVDDVAFLRVITRQAGGLQLLATGRMIVKGSMSTALRMDGWFR